MHRSRWIRLMLLVLLFLSGCGVADQPSAEAVLSAATTVPTPTATMFLRPTPHPRIPRTLIPVTPTLVTPTRSVFTVPPQNVEPDIFPVQPTFDRNWYPLYVPVSATYAISPHAVVLTWPDSNLSGYLRTVTGYGVLRFDDAPVDAAARLSMQDYLFVTVVPAVAGQQTYSYEDHDLLSGNSYQYVIYTVTAEESSQELPPRFYGTAKNALSQPVKIP